MHFQIKDIFYRKSRPELESWSEKRLAVGS